MLIIQRFKNFLRLPTDKPIEAEISHHFKHNFITNAVDGVFWMVGDSFVSVNTILPVFASSLTDSAILIGLVPALIEAGWFIPQFLMGGFVQRLPKKMPFARIMAIIERVPYIFLPLTAFLSPWISKKVALAFFMLVVAWRGVASGLVALPWQEVIAIIIPMPVRSRFFGTTYTFGRIMGVVGSGITSLILARLAYPNNYALTFLIGAVFIWISFYFFSRTREPELPIAVVNQKKEQKSGILRDISSYKAVLKRDPNFVRFLISRALGQMGYMAVAFFAVYGIQHYRLADQQAAVFTGLIFISGTLGHMVFGLIGDRIGPRQTLLIADLLLGVVLFLAHLSPGIWSIYLIFLIFGFSQSGYMIGGLVIGMELGPVEERPIYIGLARSLPGMTILIAPLIGGVLVSQFGYQTMFLVALLFNLGGAGMLLSVKNRKNATSPES